MWRLLIFVIACGGPSAPLENTGPQPPTVITKRVVTARTALPKAIQPLLPAHGIYVAGGGLMSSAWRVVIDADANTIAVGTNAKPGSSSVAMQNEQRKDLSPRNETLLMRLAEDAWREPPPKAASDPTADYDEILVVLDGDDAFFLEGFGPIRRPLAAKAIIEIRAAAGL
ncbi:MAG: hypothetical protein ABI867_37130 [Kofleriaceae bacterium]